MYNNEHGSLPFDWIFCSLRTRTALIIKSHVTPYSDNDHIKEDGSLFSIVEVAKVFIVKREHGACV